MPIPQIDKTINRLIMRDEVYQTLLNWIIEGALRPGEKLLDKELAENLGVSRTPVREALRRLEDKGLVEASAGRWTRVAEISDSDADMLYPIIQTLEELAIQMAISHMKQQDFNEMEQANEDLRAAIKAGQPVKASKADADFHDVVIRMSGNHYLITILKDLKIKYRWIDVLYFEDCANVIGAVDEHKQIVAALKTGDLKGAVKSMQVNWRNTLKRLQTLPEKQSQQRIAQ